MYKVDKNMISDVNNGHKTEDCKKFVEERFNKSLKKTIFTSELVAGPENLA